jgi:enoyl-CoA hydratase/carnithine racemase
MGDTVLYERRDALGYLTLNRPRVLNAMNDGLLRDLADALRAGAADGQARVLVLRGAGRAFCAGADLDETPGPRDPNAHRAARMKVEQDVARLFRHLEKPIVAQVHGAAIGGGCVLALLCDLRIAAEGTRFELPEVRVGATASLGGVYTLTRVVGLGRAFELLYLAEPLDAAAALAIGLVNRVVPQAEIDSAVAALATRIAGHFPLELALTREAIHRGLDVDFDAAVDAETTAAMLSQLGGAAERGMAEARRGIREKKRGG